MVGTPRDLEGPPKTGKKRIFGKGISVFSRFCNPDIFVSTISMSYSFGGVILLVMPSLHKKFENFG